MGKYLECGCYLHTDGRVTRCPTHDASVELAMALEDLHRECPETYRENTKQSRNAAENTTLPSGRKP